MPVGVALVAGVWGIGRGSLWQDEATTLALAGRPLPQLWDTLGTVDAVHGVYYLLVHVLLGVAGAGPSPEVLLRVPSLLATAGAALGVAVVGRRLGSPAAGLFAGTAYALAPVVVYHAQEARSFALVAAAVVLACYLLVRAAEQPRRLRWWAGYAAAVALACLLNLFAAFFLLAHAVTLAACRVGFAVLWRWAVACLAGLLCAAPVGWIAYGQQDQVSHLDVPTWATAGALVTRFAGGGVLLAVTGVLAGLAVLHRADRAGPVGLPLLALPLAVLPPAALLLISQAHPFYADRYVLYSMLGLSWLIGAGAAAGARLPRLPAVAGVLPVALVAGLGLPAQEQVRRIDSRPDDPAAAARLVGQGARPGDVVLFLPSVRRLVAEAYPVEFRHARDAALKLSGPASGTLAGRELPPEDIVASIGDAPRIWTVSRSHAADADLSSSRDRAKRDLLRDDYRQVRVTRVLGYAVRLYERGDG
ncbi:mannosyltransferase [Microtetraspora sp. NBRC 13810]|nr:mannosyltransferase [Microtetraspora sp. NBRC 13810]